MTTTPSILRAPSRVVLRSAGDRGRTLLPWLDSRHSFSFGEYADRDHLGFRTLRVVNDDRVSKGAGFPPHPHRDMEIFSYVLDGELEHEDSMGNRRVLRPGEVQLMSAGSGVVHAERNPSAARGTHFLQVWIQPEARGLAPRYTEWKPQPGHENAANVLVISPDGRDCSATIRQDVTVHRLRLQAGDTVRHDLAPGRGAWLQLLGGKGSFCGIAVAEGDGAATEIPGTLTLTAREPVHALLFDLR